MHVATDANATEEKITRLRRFLRRQAADGEYYFKSKYIAEDLGLTPKEIGNLVVKLREADTDLRIERWAYTNATTWRVRLGDA